MILEMFLGIFIRGHITIIDQKLQNWRENRFNCGIKIGVRVRWDAIAQNRRIAKLVLQENAWRLLVVLEGDLKQF